MKILHIISDLNQMQGGPTSAVLGFAQAQGVLGHDVSIVATNEGFRASEMVASVKLRLYPCQRRQGHWSWQLARELPRWVTGADIVHIHDMWDHASWWGSKVCQDHGVPYVLTPHGMLEPWPLSQNSLKKKIYLKF